MLLIHRQSPEEATASAPVGLVVTEKNLNPNLQMMTWLLLALTSLMLGFRLLTRLFIKDVGAVRWDDILVLLAYVYGPCSGSELVSNLFSSSVLVNQCQWWFPRVPSLEKIYTP
jgi:hypothetical protein